MLRCNERPNKWSVYYSSILYAEYGQSKAPKFALFYFFMKIDNR